MDGVNKYIDLNADVGEGVPTEAQIMPLISSCNVACGGHYGDRSTIMKTLELAKIHGVRVGAHPGYPDKANFGRVVMNITTDKLRDSLVAQIELFRACCKEIGLPIDHLKPHGALYNEAARNQQLAEVIIDSMKDQELNVPIYSPAGGILDKIARPEFQVIPEAFADRRYNTDRSLVSRKLEGALINSPEAAWEQLSEMIFNQSVVSAQGERIIMEAQTFCVHGDTPNALKILQYLNQQLKDHEISLKR